MRSMLASAGVACAAIATAFAQRHQGSLDSCEGRPIPNVQHMDVAVPPAGRSYGWPANTMSIHRWGEEILVGFRDYSYRWKGYWQHTMFSDAVDTNDCRNVLARSLDNGLTWRIENPAGYSDYDRANPDISDCARLPGNGVPFAHPDLVFEAVWMEHTGDETRHFFHWSTDRGRTWSVRYRLPMLNGYGHLEPRTDYLVDGPGKAIVFVSGDNMTTPTSPPWSGAWISAYRTADGGRTWTASQIGEKESGIWKGMTSSVRVGPNEILTAVRNHRIVNKPHPGRIQSLADVYASTDNGATWQFRSTPWMLEENVFGNPASLVKLPSGNIVALMGNRRSSAQSRDGYLVSKLQCRVSADHGATWGPIYTIRDDIGTWDMGYQRAVVREDGKVLTVYYHTDRRSTEGPDHGEEENHRTPRRISASIFDAESLDTTPVPVDPYRKLEATAADFGTVRWHTNFFVTGFDAGNYFVFQGLLFDRGLSEITLAVATPSDGRRIEIRDGSPNGPLVGAHTTAATGGDRSFQEQTVQATNLTGRHDIYLVSRDTAAADVDHVHFISAGGTAVVQTARIVAVSDRVHHEFKSWGLTPAPYDRQLPTYAPGKAGERPSPAWGEASWLPKKGSEPEALHRAVGELGFEIGRVYLSPTLCKTNGELDATRMQDFKDHLALLAKCGVKKYAVTVWSPPEHMKLSDRVRWGKLGDQRQYLDPACAEAFAEFYVAALKDVRAAGFPAPVSVSLQNEPGTAQSYDGCVYTDTPEQQATYRQVVKALRHGLDAADFKAVPIIVPETESLVDITRFLGKPATNGFEEMQGDAEFTRAVGGFTWHTYSTAGNTKELLAAMFVYPGRDRWMTEYSTLLGIRPEHRAKSGNNELDWTLDFARRMGGDIVDQGCHYWFFWRGWHSSGAADDQHLLYGDAKRTKAYYFFQKLWQTVRGGWRVMEVTTVGLDLRANNRKLIETGHGDQWSAPVDILAFTTPDNTRACLVVINAHAEPRTIGSITGLRGSKADLFLTTKDLNMAPQGAREVKAGRLEDLHMPSWSVILVTSGGEVTSSVTPKEGVRVTWTGKGTDDQWSTAANWSGGKAPGAADDVVLDGTSSRDSRWDGEQNVASLTVTPDYKGQLIFAGHGDIAGEVVLSGRVHSARDMHRYVWMRGRRVDLSGVTEWTQASRYSGGIDLGGSEEKQVQLFTAPKMRIGDLRMYEKGTVRFAGPVIAALMEGGVGKTIDFNHQNLTARSLGCAAQVTNLGGTTITLTSWAGWSPFCFGRSKNFMPDKAPPIDLAPDQPWKLVVKSEEVEAFSDKTKRQPFAFINCRIGNCDASGGEAVVATDRCIDARGNQNVRFKETN